MPIISIIPVGLLWGGYLLLASEATGTPFVQRILGCLSSKNMRESLKDKEGVKDLIDKVDYSTMCRYTWVQFVWWLILYVIAVLLKELAPYNKANQGNIWVMLGCFFPLIVCLYAIPLRTSFLPMCFTQEALDVLDHEDGEEEEHEEERIPSIAVRTVPGSLREARASMSMRSGRSIRSGEAGQGRQMTGGSVGARSLGSQPAQGAGSRDAPLLAGDGQPKIESFGVS